MAFIDEMLIGFSQIFSAPFKRIEVLWLLVPLLLMWIILEIYFAKYKTEELGWNTALANGISLGWITLEGMRYLFSAQPTDFWLRFFVNVIILVYAGMIINFSFTHKVNPKIEFLLASPTLVYFLGIFSVLWGFGLLSITIYVLIDIIILFLVILIFIRLLKKYVKPALGQGL